MIIFSAFCRLGPFPSVFGKVKEWLMLKSYEIIKAIHVVVCTIVFFCFMIEIGKEKCSKLCKMIIF